MEFDITAFFKGLADNVELQGVVGLYEGFPAIAEEFPDEPKVVYITLCDDNLNYKYCQGSTKVLFGNFDFTLRIVGNPACDTSTRIEMRNARNIVMRELRKYSDQCIRNIVVNGSSNNLIDTQTERLYSVISARAYFI